MPDPAPAPDAGREDHGLDPSTAPGAPADGRDRLWHALLKPSRSQLVVALLLGLLGYAAVTQVRANELDNTYAGLREQELIEVLNGLTGTSRRAQEEIDRLEAALQDLRSSTRQRQAAIEQAQREADNLAVLAGEVPVRGPGIRVQVTPAAGVPLDTEIFLEVFQNLRNAGAEAIQVNGQVRLVAQSYVTETSDGIEIDGVPVDAPYVIDAIGPPHGLEQGVMFAGGPVLTLRGESYGATVDIEQLNELEITAVRDPAALQYAQSESEQ